MFEQKIKREVKRAIDEIITVIKDSVEDVCMEAIKFMFSEEGDQKIATKYHHVYNIKTVGGEFKARVIEAVSKDVTKKCTDAANDIVLSEQFLDSVVERIKKKQIGK